MDTPAIPEVVAPASTNDYFEVLTRAVFQAGVSWAQIAKYWNAYRSAFDGFDVERVASYGEADIERVLGTPGILRMRRKVVATVANAEALLRIVAEFGSVGAYIDSFDEYAATARDLKKRFAFMGDMNAWYVLFRTGHAVPRFETWLPTIRGEHPRMREMVELARTTGRSPEIG